MEGASTRRETSRQTSQKLTCLTFLLPPLSGLVQRSPILAASCVLIVRAVIVQLGFFAHALGRFVLLFLLNFFSFLSYPGVSSSRGLLDFHFPLNLWFAIGFMTVYGIVIALFKDLPDVEGDSRQDVRTLSVRLGVCVLCLFSFHTFG